MSENMEIDRLHRYITELRKRVYAVRAWREENELVSNGDLAANLKALETLVGLNDEEVDSDPFSVSVGDGAPAFFYSPWFVEGRWDNADLPIDLPTV